MDFKPAEVKFELSESATDAICRYVYPKKDDVELGFKSISSWCHLLDIMRSIEGHMHDAAKELDQQMALAIEEMRKNKE